jgi:hypothetical protein
MSKKKKIQLGKLPPRHTFFLNPYPDERFTRCPECRAVMKVRKKPFLIHIDPAVLLALNMSGRYCSDCDLLILHQDVLEDLLVRAFTQHNPSIIGNKYLVIGTLERSYWQKHKGQMTMGPALEYLHDFKKVVSYKVIPAHWGPDEDRKKT